MSPTEDQNYEMNFLVMKKRKLNFNTISKKIKIKIVRHGK